MEIKFTKKNKDAVTPIRTTDGAVGYDLTAVSKYEKGKDLIGYDTGIAVAIPKGYVGVLCSRSSVSKVGLILSNGVGIIDNDYRGTLQLVFWKYDKENANYNVGERVGQILFVPVVTPELIEVDELDSTIRGDGGFGSTGRK